jgi:FkbM family methyltransferase
MGWTRPGPQIDSAAPPEHVRVCESVSLRPGLSFTLVAAEEAVDPSSLKSDRLSQELAAGVLPEDYHSLIALLEALVPPGGRVVDLGTHVGTFTLSAAALGFEVIGVEASPRNASLLKASLERNRFERVRLVNAAVSDRPGTLEFCQAGPYGHVAASGHWPANVRVPAVAVDDLLDDHGWQHVDLIKMDIEGYEVAGLKGLARRLSRADAPPLFVESNGHTLSFFGQTPAHLKACLKTFGYQVYQVEGRRLISTRPADLQPATCVDYLALKNPAQRAAVSRAFQIDPPPSRETIIDELLQTCRSKNPDDRDYIARALRDSPVAILARQDVLQAVQGLRGDAIESVRAAAASIPLPPAWWAWCLQVFKPLIDRCTPGRPTKLQIRS